jgi:hypothetical protein
MILILWLVNTKAPVLNAHFSYTYISWYLNEVDWIFPDKIFAHH